MLFFKMLQGLLCYIFLMIAVVGVGVVVDTAGTVIAKVGVNDEGYGQ